MTTPFLKFAADVLGLTFSRPWGVLLRVAIDGIEPGDLEGEDREIARVLFGNLDRIPPLARAMLVWSLGRGSGKTTIAVAVGLFLLVTADVSGAGPGDLPAVVVVAPTKALAKLSLRIARAIVTASPLARIVERETEDGVELRRPDGRLVSFEVIAASRGGTAGRGRSVVGIILDEAEFFAGADTEQVVTDEDVLHGLLPRLLPGGLVLLLSTPWPTTAPTLMASLVESEFGAPETALVAKGPSLVMQPGKPSLVQARERMMLTDPGKGSREFDVERTSAGAATFFSSDAVKAAVTSEPPEVLGPCYAGIDLGLVSDSSALVIASRIGSRIEIVGVHELRPTKGNPLSPTATIDAFAEIAKAHGARVLVHDQHYAQLVAERCGEHGIASVLKPGGAEGVMHTHVVTKRALDERRVRMSAHDRLVAALGTVRATPTAGGRISISMPRGRGLGHSDLASAFVLAVWAAETLEAPRDVHLERVLDARLIRTLASFWPQSFQDPGRIAVDIDPEELSAPGASPLVLARFRTGDTE